LPKFTLEKAGRQTFRYEADPFGFCILNAAGALLAEGQTRHVCAITDEKPKRLPKGLMEGLRPFVYKERGN
jgi:acyl-CoA thioesterase FadM